MIQVAAPRRGVMEINWNGFGWAETYDFTDLTDSAVITHMQNIAALRAFLLPPDATILYGRVVIPGQPRKAKLALPAPIAGNSSALTTPPDAFINDPATTLLFRIEGESYFRKVLHVKALPDGAVQDNTLLLAAPGGSWVTGFGVSPPVVATSATWAAALKKFFDYYVNVCTINRRGTIPLVGGGTGPGYNCASMNALAYRKVSNVKCGRPFDLPLARRPQR